jgi:ABC-2 type transport system ATP-binding protein
MDSIIVEHLIKKFGNIVAVDDISFNVKEGEIFAFLGPNGAGKTTTIKILTTLLTQTSGKVSLNGIDTTINKDAVREGFGIVFQDPSLDEELTAYENMNFHGILYHVPKDLLKQRIEELLKFVELWDRKDHFVKTFSGGMRRRLEIARGLLHHPKVLFLDEPTTGLDPQTRNHIWNYIVALSKTEDITVFFTTHYIEEAEKIAQRVAIIDHGKILTVETPKVIMKNTKTKNLEDAFIKLTGNNLRDEDLGASDQMRNRMRMRQR